MATYGRKSGAGEMQIKDPAQKAGLDMGKAADGVRVLAGHPDEE